MNDKRLKQVHTTLAFLRSVIMSGEPMTNEVRNDIDDAIYNLRDADKDIKKQLLILYKPLNLLKWNKEKKIYKNYVNKC